MSIYINMIAAKLSIGQDDDVTKRKKLTFHNFERMLEVEKKKLQAERDPDRGMLTLFLHLMHMVSIEIMRRAIFEVSFKCSNALFCYYT